MTTLTPTHHAQSEFERLFQRSRHRAFNLAFRLTGNAADAEDVTQDAYLRAWNNFESYDDSRSFEGWLFRILTNRVIDLRRRRMRVPIYSLNSMVRGDEGGEPIAYEFADPESDPEQIVIGPMMEERLQKALAALPDSYRTAVLLCDVEQRPYEEIAAAMHCAIGTVRSRIHRARIMLRRYLESGGAHLRKPVVRRNNGPCATMGA